MSGTQDEIFAAKNPQEILQPVQAGSEQIIKESAQEAENLQDKELTPAQKMDLLLRGHSPAQMKKEIEKLRKEAAKYRTSSKKEEEQKLALQTRAQEIQNELDALKQEHKNLTVIRKLDRAGCIKSELVAKISLTIWNLPKNWTNLSNSIKRKTDFFFRRAKTTTLAGRLKPALQKYLHLPSRWMLISVLHWGVSILKLSH